MSQVPVTPCGFIDDGYSLPFSIPEVPGVSIGLSGTYRPMTQKELQKFLKSLNVAASDKPAGQVRSSKVSAEDEIDTAACEGVVRHLIDWNLLDRDGNPVPITTANVSRIYPPSLQANLINVVCGMSGLSDVTTSVAVVVADTTLNTAEKLVKVEKILNADKPSEASDEKN